SRRLVNLRPFLSRRVGVSASEQFGSTPWMAGVGPRVASATRDLPAGDPLLRSACQLRCLATPVVLRDAWMARHALGVLNQQRRDSVHEVFRNVVKHPGP